MTRAYYATVAVMVAAALALGAMLLQPAPQAVQAAPPVTEPPPAAKAPAKDDYVETIKPLFAKYCITCHSDKKMSAGLTLEAFKDTASARKSPDTWDLVKEHVETKQMPPKGKPQPTDAERKQILAWIEASAAKVDCGLARDPGRPTIRRLNKSEYNNTIRDLVGVDFKPADNFPADDVGYGFDNIGDVLSMPPILLEKYLTAAEAILDKAIVLPRTVASVKEQRRPQNVSTTLGPLAKQDKRIALTSNGAAFFEYEFGVTGEYVIRARCYGEQAGDALPHLQMQLDRKPFAEHDVDAVQGKAKVYEKRIRVTAGRHDVRFAYTNDFMAKEPKPADRNLYIEVFEIEGPFQPELPPPPATHARIMVSSPEKGRSIAAKQIIEAFANRAYRRPVLPDEVARLLKLFEFGDSPGQPFEQAIKHPLKAVLVSPHFLFRLEKDAEPNNPTAVHSVTQHELASRLSYFLWSSMPDDELRRLADEGKLAGPAVEAQVRRMLKDPKASALAENFTGQWLMLRTLATMNPDKKTFASFDPVVRSAMIRETELYFDHVVREDRSILEFLDSDYSFLNDKLAKFYGVPDVRGSEFRKVKWTDPNRGGILTHGSILTVTSNPTRTSPVKRGKWILENILGTPPPPPPDDVPELEEDEKAVATGSLRQRLEKHRENAACATCHAKMDPLGFGLENFDGVGMFRTHDGKFKVDAAGVLPDGAKFSGPGEMRKVLVGKADQFRKNMAEKMLTYALGRGLEYYDRCTVEDTMKALKANGDKIGSLIVAIATSDSFQKRRGGSGGKD